MQVKIHSTIFTSLVLLFGCLFTFISTPHAHEASHKRIVSIGGSITEIIFALGEEDRLIARDSTSVFPKEALSLPDVGYIRQLAPEGVLSVNPDLIIALEGSGPPETIDTLKGANVPMVFISEGYTADNIKQKILAVGKALNVPAKAAKLASKTEAEINKIIEQINSSPSSKKVLFILSMRGGKVLASGQKTAANGIIALAGAENVISEFDGYKQISDESIITAQPDAILMMDRRGDHSQSDTEIFSHPAIALTPAGKNAKIIRMDGLYMLGFGPRTADAVSELFNSLNHKN